MQRNEEQDYYMQTNKYGYKTVSNMDILLIEC